MTKKRKKSKAKETVVTCPYCNQLADLQDSSVVYNQSYGMIWICLPCQAWVGVHKDSREYKPLGRLANKELREAKIEVHTLFDKLWKHKIIKYNVSKNKARDAGYKWLARQMSIPTSKCHIGMFNLQQCQLAVEICKPYAEKLENKVNV